MDVDADQDGKRLWGLNYARSLNFTDAQYEEALKRIDSLDNANQLLVALIDVSSFGEKQQRLATDDADQVQQPDESMVMATATATGPVAMLRHNQQQQDLRTESYSSLSASSCYSSLTCFPSFSSDQSLDSLTQQQQQQPQQHNHQQPHQRQQIQRHISQPVSLRKIYVDGPNVARTHGKNVTFSWPGIKLCVDWFHRRQHKVKVFVPVDKCSSSPTTGGDNGKLEVLDYLNQLGALIKTPAGCNDDLFVIEAAKHNNGVIVSNDLYRVEKRFNDDIESFVNRNRLPYVFVDDLFIPASDPLGRRGPTLDEFLREPVQGELMSYEHQKLHATKSHQRYQRNGFNQRLALPQQVHFRSLQLTRSCPGDQSRFMNSNESTSHTNIINSGGSGSSRGSSRGSSSNNNNISPLYRNPQSLNRFHDSQQQQVQAKQLRKSISAVCANGSSGTLRQPIGPHHRQQPVYVRKPAALCRTKSHNV